MTAVPPTYEQIFEQTKTLAERHGPAVELMEIGKSDCEALPIPLLKITDPNIPLDQKQIMLVTGGTHGSEETGRATAMALAEWLMGPGQTHLSTQCFLICTCLNPDGARLNTYHNGNDVNIYTSCRLGDEKPMTGEAQAVLNVADEYLPNCCVDIHGLAGGAIGDSQYVTPGLFGNISAQIGFMVAYEMNQAATGAGFPQRDPHVPRMQRDPNEMKGMWWGRKLAWEMNTLSFTVEITEHMYPIEESVRSGMARITRLIEIGERVQWYQPYPGYPMDLIANNAVCCLMSHGTTPGQRRESRRELMRAIHEDGIHGVKRDPSDNARGKRRIARAHMVCRDQLRNFPNRFTVQMLLDRRAKLNEVRHLGKALEPGAEYGFETRQATEGFFVRINIGEQPQRGDNVFEVDYELPVEPHDPL